MKLALLLVAVALPSVVSDVYMHMMRGSNNRLKAAGVNANNQNRLFNSQNNAKGGYNVGIGGTEEFYVGSELLLEWTAQHGCGNEKDDCQIIIQYMCSDANPELKDGTTEDTPPDNGNAGSSYGQHEPYDYYKACKARQRNEGLFTADRRRFTDGRFYYSQYTRQNENGNRRGYECQEERDYYPYWQPTPWRDIAVLVDEKKVDTMCPFYRSHSENVVGRWYCSDDRHNNEEACLEGRFYYPQDEKYINYERELWKKVAEQDSLQALVDAGDTTYNGQLRSAQNRVKQLNKTVTDAHDDRRGTWEQAEENDPSGKSPMRCRSTDFTRVNHLGNTASGQPASFVWKIPDTPNDACVLRLRYNMSSSDYPNWRIWSEHNGYDKSPITQNMKVPVGLSGKVELAINTNQIGRTFQDRSHVFKIAKRPAKLNSARIVNLNVRGKRGNIVQAYPAVEYDYHPNRLTVCSGDYVHMQWTGSNTNPRNYAGQGTAGTDRTNIVQMGTGNLREFQAENFQMNMPVPLAEVDMFGGPNNDDVALKFATLEQTDDLLNDADPYFNHEPIQFTLPSGKDTETYHFMCTRNNNFSNRSQKGQITVLKKGQCPANPIQPGAHMDDLLPPQ